MKTNKINVKQIFDKVNPLGHVININYKASRKLLKKKYRDFSNLLGDKKVAKSKSQSKMGTQQSNENIA